MWPFKKKDVKSVSERDSVLAELRAFKSVGETFNYLGRTCVVTGHLVYIPGLGGVPALQYDYCDNQGIIHSVEVGYSEFQAILKQQIPTKGG